MRGLRSLHGERGSQVVEFALIAPILLYLVLCIPVFALFARSWIIVSGAAREGARAASFYNVANREEIARQTVARNMFSLNESGGYFDQERDVRVAVEADAGVRMLVVTVTYHQPTYLPLLHRILNPAAPEKGATVPLEAHGRFMLEST